MSRSVEYNNNGIDPRYYSNIPVSKDALEDSSSPLDTYQRFHTDFFGTKKKVAVGVVGGGAALAFAVALLTFLHVIPGIPSSAEIWVAVGAGGVGAALTAAGLTMLAVSGFRHCYTHSQMEKACRGEERIQQAVEHFKQNRVGERHKIFHIGERSQFTIVAVFKNNSVTIDVYRKGHEPRYARNFDENVATDNGCDLCL